MTPGRRKLLGGAVAAGALVAGAAVSWSKRRTADDALDAMWKMRFERPEGGELVMASLRGKPLLINFWATWCAPCIRELPDFDRFQREFTRGQVLALAIDGPSPVREFLRKRPLKLTVGIGGLDGVDLLHQLGNLQGALPFTVLVGADGRILQRRMGETSFADLQAWTKGI